MGFPKRLGESSTRQATGARCESRLGLRSSAVEAECDRSPGKGSQPARVEMDCRILVSARPSLGWVRNSFVDRSISAYRRCAAAGCSRRINAVASSKSAMAVSAHLTRNRGLANRYFLQTAHGFAVAHHPTRLNGFDAAHNRFEQFQPLETIFVVFNVFQHGG